MFDTTNKFEKQCKCTHCGWIGPLSKADNGWTEPPTCLLCEGSVMVLGPNIPEVISLESPKTPVNWNKPMYVQSISSPEMKIITTGKHTEERFSGVLLADRDGHLVYRDGFRKDYYEPYCE